MCTYPVLKPFSPGLLIILGVPVCTSEPPPPARPRLVCSHSVARPTRISAIALQRLGKGFIWPIWPNPFCSLCPKCMDSRKKAMARQGGWFNYPARIFQVNLPGAPLASFHILSWLNRICCPPPPPLQPSTLDAFWPSRTSCGSLVCARSS
eukprot:2077836-Rhodomonas_salina.1